jgi:hypothetical protein
LATFKRGCVVLLLMVMVSACTSGDESNTPTGHRRANAGANADTSPAARYDQRLMTDGTSAASANINIHCSTVKMPVNPPGPIRWSILPDRCARRNDDAFRLRDKLSTVTRSITVSGDATVNMCCRSGAQCPRQLRHPHRHPHRHPRHPDTDRLLSTRLSALPSNRRPWLLECRE